MLENFIYAKQKSLFEEALNNGEVLNEAIVFIEDTKEIWNHGTYFDGNAVDLSNIEASIQNILDNKADKTEIPTKVSELENDVPYVMDYTIPQGVSIMDASGNIMTAEEWSEDKGLTGLVVSDGTRNVVMAVTDVYPENAADDMSINTLKKWSTALYGVDIEGLDNIDDLYSDFNSKANTDAILSALSTSSNPDETNNAAVVARNYSSGIYGVGEWDLPAGGVVDLLVSNRIAIKDISQNILNIGDANIYYIPEVWTSSEVDANNAGDFIVASPITSLRSMAKNKEAAVIPVKEISTTTLREKVETLESKITALESNSTLVITQDSDPATIFNILSSGNYSKIKAEYVNGDYTYSGEAVEVVPNESNYSINFIGNYISSQNEEYKEFGIIFNIVVNASEIIFNYSPTSSTIYPYSWNGSNINDAIWQELETARSNNRLVVISKSDGGVAHVSYTGSGYPAYITLKTATTTYIIYNYWSEDTPYYEIIKVNNNLKQIYKYSYLRPYYYNKIEITSDESFNGYEHIEGYTDEYQGELIFGDTVYAVTFPEEITWVTIPESYKANTTYQFKIVNDIGYIWEVGNGEVAYKTEIPTKVSELENNSNYLVTESDPVFTASAASGITSENISDWNNKQNKNLYFNNLTASSWIEDTTYADYPYRCDLTCSGVTGSDYAEVTYNVAEAISGDYAPICETDIGIVKIWSKKNDSIVIPTIIITR